MAKGGFGLVWTDERQFERYDHMNQPLKLAGYLAAGLPVFVRKGCVHERFVLENDVGYVFSFIQEIDEIMDGLTEDEFNRKYDNVRRIQRLITNGFYTRKTLNDAVIRVLDLSE